MSEIKNISLYFIYISIAACLKMLPELIVIACVLIPLRKNARGYHAKTKDGCYFCSCFYATIILLTYKMLKNPFIWWGMLVLSDVIIFIMSPLDNENKRLDNKEKEYYREKSCHILALTNIICILFTTVNFYNIGNSIEMWNFHCGIITGTS